MQVFSKVPSYGEQKRIATTTRLFPEAGELCGELGGKNQCASRAAQLLLSQVA